MSFFSLPPSRPFSLLHWPLYQPFSWPLPLPSQLSSELTRSLSQLSFRQTPLLPQLVSRLFQQLSLIFSGLHPIFSSGLLPLYAFSFHLGPCHPLLSSLQVLQLPSLFFCFPFVCLLFVFLSLLLTKLPLLHPLKLLLFSLFPLRLCLCLSSFFCFLRGIGIFAT